MDCVPAVVGRVPVLPLATVTDQLVTDNWAVSGSSVHYIVRSACNKDSRILVAAPAHLSPLSQAAVWIVIKY